MHLTDVSVGAYGSFAIVGGHLPIAVGFALTSLYNGGDEVCLCFFGDGAVNTGAFHEAMNLASVWKLPVVFVCENNLYGEYSPLASTTPIQQLVERAKAYAMHSEQVDGNDVTAVHAVTVDAVDGVRAGSGPSMIEALTYRHKGHSRSDPGTYRPQAEVEKWLARDPISLLEAKLLAEGVESSRVESVRERAATNVNEALERALSWPMADAAARLEHVYV
jgi:pyruvate dehydrogenase E1 component alpha subunit